MHEHAKVETYVTDDMMAEIDKIRLHYLKCDGYRDNPCDGVFGGPTPSGQLWIGFFSERSPVPQEAVHALLPVDGDPSARKIGDLIAAESKLKDGIIRTLQCGLHMNVQTAIIMRDWLTAQIKTIEGEPR